MNFGMEVFNSIAQAAAIASPELPGDYRGRTACCTAVSAIRRNSVASPSWARRTS